MHIAQHVEADVNSVKRDIKETNHRMNRTMERILLKLIQQDSEISDLQGAVASEGHAAQSGGKVYAIGDVPSPDICTGKVQERIGACKREMTCAEFYIVAQEVKSRYPIHTTPVPRPLMLLDRICDAHIISEEERLFGPDCSDDDSFDSERFSSASVPGKVSNICWSE